MSGRRLATLLLCLTLLLLTACQNPEPISESESPDTPSPSQSVPPEVEETPNHRAEFALSYDSSSTLNPLADARTDPSNQNLAGLVYEGMFQLDNQFNAQYLLCTAYTTNENCTQWSFTLRTDAVFSDGTPLTAEHVADSLNTARSSTLYSARLAHVKSVSAVGEETVSITLSAPNGALPALLDVPVILNAGDEDIPLGTGPYSFVRGEEDTLSLERNPHWWQGHTLPLESIPLREAITTEERLAIFDTGSVTVAVSDLTDTNALGYSGSFDTWDCASTSLFYLGFNTRKGDCRDAVLRKAISLGIDRTFLAQSLLSGHADPALFPFHPNSSCYDATLAESQLAIDPVQLLQDNGYLLSNGILSKEGQGVELKLLVNTDNSFRTNVANHISQDLGKLGLNVTVSALPWDDFLHALNRGNFDLYLAQVKLTPDFNLNSLLTGSLNYGSYSNRELSDLLETYQSATDTARPVAAHYLSAALAEQMPIAPLCFLRTSVLTQWGAVSGVNPTQQNPFYGFHHWSIAS